MQDDDEDCIHNVSINQINLKTPKVMTEYSFKNQSCSLLSIPDTGAEVTVAGRNLMNSLKIAEADLYTRGNNNLRCASNTRMKVIGTMQIKLKINQM